MRVRRVDVRTMVPVCLERALSEYPYWSGAGFPPGRLARSSRNIHGEGQGLWAIRIPI